MQSLSNPLLELVNPKKVIISVTQEDLDKSAKYWPTQRPVALVISRTLGGVWAYLRSQSYAYQLHPYAGDQPNKEFTVFGGPQYATHEAAISHEVQLLSYTFDKGIKIEPFIFDLEVYEILRSHTQIKIPRIDNHPKV